MMGVLANNPIGLAEVHSIGDVSWEDLGGKMEKNKMHLKLFCGARTKYTCGVPSGKALPEIFGKRCARFLT